MKVALNKDWRDKVIIVRCPDPVIRLPRYFPNLDLRSQNISYPAIAGLVGSYSRKSQRDENFNDVSGLSIRRGAHRFIVTAHTVCAGVKATIQGCDDPVLQRFLSLSKEFRKTIPDLSEVEFPEQLTLAVEEGLAHLSWDNIRTYPWVKQIENELVVDFRKLDVTKKEIGIFELAHPDDDCWESHGHDALGPYDDSEPLIEVPSHIPAELLEVRQ